MKPKQNTKIDGKLNLNISEKFVCLSITVGTFCNSKKVKDIKQEGHGDALVTVKADATRIKAHKTLLVSPEIDAINTHMGKFTTWLRSRCLSSIFKGGLYILPNGLIDEIEGQAIAMDLERAALIEEAVAAFPQRKEEAKEELANGTTGESMYEESDYPTVDQFRACFKFTRRYLTFHVPESLRSVSERLYAREAKKAQEHFKLINDEVTALLRTSAAELVSHMVERLTPAEDGKKKIFRDSMTEKLRDFVQTFDARNITDDKELAEQVKQIGKLLSGVEVDRIRDSDELRTRLHMDMSAIKEGLDGLVINRPGRKYDFSQED